ncbi:O(6)-methylguanine-induced apoptosis 2 [Bombina bombina]|uniref:O(6)-methylguanine-induced apoptosis 2 n=1 Tax=Bombina bombina TaxID=8345 RepID=UPI00235A7590|nr:O(6)-methylguanine-induced apoptosis 2 [Bombina bombina]
MMTSGMGRTDTREMSVRRIQHQKYKTLQRGFKIPASPCSIPTKYQTIFIQDSEKKGFSSRTQRFSYGLTQNENPGPGSYEVGQQLTDNVSFSKKGTGGFPSKVSRTSRFKIAQSPAPNAYYIQDALFSKKDFSNSYSSMFHHSIATAVSDNKNNTPAPNKYDACIHYSHPNNNVCARAAFSSKTRRELVTLDSLKGPSPCHYTVKDSFVKPSPTTLVSCFKSKTSRDTLNLTSDNPGPASYNPYGSLELQKKIVFPRKHYLCFSAPAVSLPKAPSPPGPGQYEIVDYEGPPRQYISSAVFLSNTSRWTGDVSGGELPGPGSYCPELPVKQSFLSNSGKKWIPA